MPVTMRLCWVVAGVLLVGCDDDGGGGGGTDASVKDASVSVPDSGQAGADSSASGDDANMAADDAGQADDVGLSPDSRLPLPPGDFDLEAIQVGMAHDAVRYLAAVAGAPAPIPVSDDPPPALGEAYVTPFNTVIRALTAGPNSNHFYSQLQAFSYDNAYVLLAEDVEGSPSAETVVRTVPGFESVLRTPVGEWGNPRWHPTDYSKLVHFDSNADETVRIQLTDAATGETETLFEFAAPYQRYLSNQSFDELSRNGRWITGEVVAADGQALIFAFDLTDRALGAQLDPAVLYGGPCTPDPEFGPLDPDWIGASPLGRYLMVQWAAAGTARCEGLESYDIRTGAYVGHVTAGHPHSDLTVLADGTTEVFVTLEDPGPAPGGAFVAGEAAQDVDSENPALSYRELPGPATGESEPRYLYATDYGAFEHISCRGPAGWCLATGYPFPDNGATDPLEDELYLLRLDGTGVVRLAHHHSTGREYFSQPRASFSADGRYVIFDSDWGFPSGDTIAYIIDLAEVP